MAEKLALFGGPKTINYQFIRYNTIGEEEIAAVVCVLRSGILSKFVGAWCDDFYGGDQVRGFENEWRSYFNVKHAIAVNSNTSGLITAIGAIGVEPGDEVIVSPWTMSATGTAILIWNAIPVFADIEDETFNLDPKSIEKNITEYTRAIAVTDIFGHAADLDPIMKIAQKYNLKVIEDAAQAPGAKYKGRYVGTIADIGVFSLNYHKHIHTGEGGVCVTNCDDLAERMCLIRNHGEAVVGNMGRNEIDNVIGFNFRLGEIEAAIGIQQLKKLEGLLARKIEIADRLSTALGKLEGVRPPIVKKDCVHVYYSYPIVLDIETIGVTGEKIEMAIRAEGVSVSQGVDNLHLLPMYQKRIAYGKKGFPWNYNGYKGKVNYFKGICPTAERLKNGNFISIVMCLYQYSDEDIHAIIRSFYKVWDNLDELRERCQGPWIFPTTNIAQEA